MSKYRIHRDQIVLDVNLITERQRRLIRKKSKKIEGTEEATILKEKKSKQLQETEHLELNKETTENVEKHLRVFLYMKPQSILYSSEGTRIQIELSHEKNTITCLSEKYTENNIIDVYDFKLEKPTFSITIQQDNIEDITLFSDAPLKLTLYECYEAQPRSSDSESAILGSIDSRYDTKSRIIRGSDSNADEIEFEEEEPIVLKRRAVAQGYIDLLQFFLKKRSNNVVDAILYPLHQNSHNVSCKMQWEIYSLMPLIKDVNFSNAVFLTFTSLYYVDEDLMDNCENLIATLSFKSKKPNKNNEYEKIFICHYTAFTKQIIAEQTLSYKWESMKNSNIDNYHSMAINSDITFNIYKLFNNLLCTENAAFKFDDIDIQTNYALICNSMHRYILSDKMQSILEDNLAFDRYGIEVDIFQTSEPENILLQGFIDLSVFMYPNVNLCSFAVEMKPVGMKPSKSGLSPKNIKSARKVLSKTSMKATDTLHSQGKTLQEKTTFAIIKICLKTPITESAGDLNVLYNVLNTKRDIFRTCEFNHQFMIPTNTFEAECEEAYRCFDHCIQELMNYIIENNIKSINDNRPYFCTESGNMMSHILPLIACDFNVRFPTKNTIEFTNLMTTVYVELIKRIHKLIMKQSDKTRASSLNYKHNQDTLITRLSIIKFLNEINNKDMADYLLRTLKKACDRNPLLNFYIFLYDMELSNFEEAFNYLSTPLNDKDMEGQLFIPIIEIYLGYMKDVSDTETYDKADENLLVRLIDFCEREQSKCATGWVILYCIYKKYKYLPGTEYTRWRYEYLSKYGILNITNLPSTRWEIYNNYHLELKSLKGSLFCNVIYLFLHLGLYYFALWVFNEIAEECSEIERYLFHTTFALFLNNLPSDFKTMNFSVDKMRNPHHLRAMLALVNGNVEYSRDPYSAAAMNYYGSIFKMEFIENYSKYQLGILRYAYNMITLKEFEKAEMAFGFAKSIPEHYMICDIGKGKALYYAGKLKEAEKYFASSTSYDMYLPNTWAYLALINLRLGENFKALECWKYAHLIDKEEVNREILSELEKINHNDILLFVDVPLKKTSEFSL